MIYLLAYCLLAVYLFAQSAGVVSGYTAQLKTYGPVLAVSYSVVALAGLYLLEKYLKRLKKKPYNGSSILPTLAHLIIYTVIFVSYSLPETFYTTYKGRFPGEGLSFLNSMYIFVFALITAFFLPRVLKSPLIKKYLHAKPLFLLVGVSFYAAFACMGDPLFFHGGGAFNLTTVTASVFLLFVLWLIPVGLEVLYLFERASLKLAETTGEKKISSWKIWLRTFSIMFLIWVVYLIAFNPANMTRDSIGMWAEALKVGKIGYFNFPAIVIMLARLLALIIKHPSFIVLLQISVFASISASFLVLIQKEGVKRKYIYIFVAVFAALPVNGLMLVTLWSNIPYTASLLGLTYLLVKYLKAKRKFATPKNLVLLALALLMTFTTRNTGFLPAFLCVVFLLIEACRPLNKKLLLGLIASGLLIFAVRGPLYTALCEAPLNIANYTWYAPFDGLQSVVYFDGKLPPCTEKFMMEQLPLMKWKEGYLPYYTNQVVYPESLQKKAEEPGFSREIMGYYFETLQTAPLLLVRNRLNKADLVWNVTQPKEIHNDRMSIFIAPNDLGIKRHENILTSGLRKFYYLTVVIAPVDMVLYRAGYFVILVLLLGIFLYVRSSSVWLLCFLPMVGDMAALLLAMGWPSFRNVWHIQVITVFVLFYLLAMKGKYEVRSTK